MSEDLKALLTRRVQLIDTYIAGLPARADEASKFLASYPAKLAKAERDRAEVLQVLATLGVPAAPLAPRDITTTPGRLELGVAGLSISPGERPSIEDLRLYAGTMRAMYEQAVTQARQATDLVHALEHRQQQAVMDTSDLAGVPRPDRSAPVQQDQAAPVTTVANLRQGVVYTDRDGWVWRWDGAYAAVPPGQPLMQELDGEVELAEVVIRDRGPLRVRTEPAEFAEPAPVGGSDPTDTRPDETPKAGV